MTTTATDVPLSIRPATRADVPAIVRMLADDPLGQTRERSEEPLPESYYTAFEAIVSDPRHKLVVIEQAGEIAGTLQLTLLPGLSYQGAWRAQIEAVHVDTRFRGQRIGQRLLEWAIAEAQAHGCHLVQPTSHASRTDAQRFYERLGFVASHVGMKHELAPPAQEQGVDELTRHEHGGYCASSPR